MAETLEKVWISGTPRLWFRHPSGARQCPGCHHPITERLIAEVVDEMELLYQKFGTRVIVMMDDTYNVSRQRVEETIEESLKRNLQMKWMPLGRAPYFIRDIDLFRDLRRAGCFMCLVGLEVADDEELRRIKKGITVDQVKETVAKLREAGIATVLTWMIGFEDDDEEKVKNRFAAVDEIDPDIIALQFLTPIPGSPIWDEVTRKGLIRIEDLNKKIKQWDFHQPIICRLAAGKIKIISSQKEERLIPVIDGVAHMEGNVLNIMAEV